MKIVVALIMVAFLAGCTSSGRSTMSYGPILCAAGGQPVVGAFVRHGAADEKPPMSMGKKIAIGVASAGAVYAAGEEWIWGGKGGRHEEPGSPPSRPDDVPVLEIVDNAGEITIVIVRDGSFDGTAN